MRLAILIFSLLATACSFSVVTVDGRELGIGGERFRDYAESVFRAQNELAAELSFAIETRDLSNAALIALEDAETALFEACAGLNAVAVRQRDGEGRRVFADREAALEVPDCERATIDARAVLRSMAG